MGYIACVQLKVQVNKGGKTSFEIRQPGQPVPEASTWSNPELWVKRGYIRPDKNTVVPRGSIAPPAPMRALTAEELAARKERKAAQARGELPLQTEGTAFIPAGPENIGPITGTDLDDEPAEVDLAGAEGEPTVEPDGKAALLELSKKELFAMAKKLKIEVSDRANKDAIVKAILSKDA